MGAEVCGNLFLIINQIRVILQNFIEIMGALLIKAFKSNEVYTLIKSFFNWLTVYCFKFFLRYTCYFIQVKTEISVFALWNVNFVFQFLKRKVYHAEQA